MFPVSFPHLRALAAPTAIGALGADELTELQRGLSLLGYPVRSIDGQIGPRTRGAWAEFKTDVFPGNPELVGAESIALLESRCSALPSAAGVSMAGKADVMKAIRLECMAQGLGLPTQIAYVLATTQWETAQTFAPVREAFFVAKNEAAAEAWRKANLSYYPFYGRGFVQLTWQRNYEAYSAILNMDLTNNRDLALDPHVALFVLVHGFKIGAFTGRKITDYINAGGTDFINARRCINGVDKAAEIAGIAQSFMTSII